MITNHIYVLSKSIYHLSQKGAPFSWEMSAGIQFYYNNLINSSKERIPRNLFTLNVEKVTSFPFLSTNTNTHPSSHTNTHTHTHTHTHTDTDKYTHTHTQTRTHTRANDTLMF